MSLAEENQLLADIAAQFAIASEVKSVAPLGNGNINSTFLVTATATTGRQQRFVLQRINAKVFRQPELVIQNMAVLGEHLSAANPASTDSETAILARRWEMPQILPTRQGKHYWVDAAGEYWRAISFIENSYVRETVADVAHAEEVGYGLAMFHRLINELPADRLADTLPGFHITPTYLADYERVLKAYEPVASDPQAEAAAHCLAFIENRKDWAHVLEKAKAKGHLQLRPIHGDPKVKQHHDGQ